MRAWVAPMLLAVSCVIAAPCHAGKAERQRAMELFEESEQRYRAGELEEAQRLLLEAYALDPNPVLQYNLGRVYEALGKLEEAAGAFREFLDGAPDAPDRGAIERRIETLQKQIADRKAQETRERERAKKPPPPPPKPPPPLQDTGPGVTPWIIAGAGAAALLGGVVAGVLANKAHDDAVADPSFRGAQDSQDKAVTFATIANVGFVVGGAAVVVGVGWGLMDQPDTPPDQIATRAWQGPPTTLVFRGAF
jgi:tetratricopeptide (TPR) repeat protein